MWRSRYYHEFWNILSYKIFRSEERIDVIVKMIKANAIKEQITLYGFTETEYKKAESAL